MYGKGMSDAVTAFIILVLIIGIAIGAFFFWLLPIIWRWLMPFIHAWTAP